MSNRPRTKYVVCGYLNGEHFSIPGFDFHSQATGYAVRKGWTDIVVIRDCEFVGG